MSDVVQYETEGHLHRFSIDTDTCKCGGQVVYFEDGDKFGLRGEGCEIAGWVWKPDQKIVELLEQEPDGEEYLYSINEGSNIFNEWQLFRDDQERRKNEPV